MSTKAGEVQCQFKKAVNGEREALSFIADAFDKGELVHSNKQAAITFYAFAGELGDPKAALVVAQRYKEGVDVKKDMDCYLQWLISAAELGSYEATRELANIKSPKKGDPILAYVVAGLTLGIIVS